MKNPLQGANTQMADPNEAPTVVVSEEATGDCLPVPLGSEEGAIIAERRIMEEEEGDDEDIVNEE